MKRKMKEVYIWSEISLTKSASLHDTQSHIGPPIPLSYTSAFHT